MMPETGVTIARGLVTSVSGGARPYRWYRPAPMSARAGDLVVLGHGFRRGQEHMDGLARALARAGFPTVTLDFHADPPWAGHHFRNGLDMIRVADALGARRVVHAGFSAGGLAALAAGRNDPRTLGVVTLDLVDADGLGGLMAAGFDRPLIGLVGEPSSCNAYNKGLSVLTVGRRATIARFAGSDHCDFESPTDWLCRLLCAGGAVRGEERREAIIREAVSAVGRLMSAGPTESRGPRP
ncbi:alpha/beta hydrolase [Thiocystis violacea]|uniref:alpha/beta hydrolase n=1 Tax=Thiocystis violacea TaxID=13725 RepID=UPI001F5B1E7A|nr:alpha/beta hydrolase [Thiocystis violacea]